MKRIRLSGKHAVGDHEYTLVDDDVFDQLNAHRWKAKPNGDGNNIYAIRVEKGADGISRDIRMHRMVLGYSGPLDVDHIDGNALNNQRDNLRVVSRSINCLNRKTFTFFARCQSCSEDFEVINRSNVAPTRCARCIAEDPDAGYAPRSFVAFMTCQCGKSFTAQAAREVHCSKRCKERSNQRAKRQRRKESTGFTLTPIQLARGRERSRAWRERKSSALSP